VEIKVKYYFEIINNKPERELNPLNINNFKIKIPDGSPGLLHN
jgi:hypothetical protein